MNFYKEPNKFLPHCVHSSSQPEAVKKYMGSTHKFSVNKETSLAVKKTLISTCAMLRSSMQMSARIFNHNELFPLEVWVWLLFLQSTYIDLFKSSTQGASEPFYTLGGICTMYDFHDFGLTWKCQKIFPCGCKITSKTKINFVWNFFFYTLGTLLGMGWSCLRAPSISNFF